MATPSAASSGRARCTNGPPRARAPCLPSWEVWADGVMLLLPLLPVRPPAAWGSAPARGAVVPLYCWYCLLPGAPVLPSPTVGPCEAVEAVGMGGWCAKLPRANREARSDAWLNTTKAITSMLGCWGATASLLLLPAAHGGHTVPWKVERTNDEWFMLVRRHVPAKEQGVWALLVCAYLSCMYSHPSCDTGPNKVTESGPSMHPTGTSISNPKRPGHQRQSLL